jgi:hypothetical protein
MLCSVQAPPADIEESDVMLAESARLDLMLARDLHARALATEDNVEAATLARAYQGVTRSMRQSLALLAKFKEGRVRAAREAQRARPRNEARIAARREAVRRVMFAETDEDEHEDRWDWIDARLGIEALPDDFADQPLDAQVVEICAEMGVDREAAAAWRETPSIDYDLADDGGVDCPRPVFGWTGGPAPPREPAIANSG